MQIHLLSQNTMVFGANIFLTEKSKYMQIHIFSHTIFVEIVCIMRHQESEKRSAVTMSLVSILFAKVGPHSETHLAQ